MIFRFVSRDFKVKEAIDLDMGERARKGWKRGIYWSKGHAPHPIDPYLKLPHKFNSSTYVRGPVSLFTHQKEASAPAHCNVKF